MSNRFVRKLSGLATLSSADIAALERATAHPRRYAARRDLIREGDVPGPMFVMLEGWACRYKDTKNGERQITAYLIPGDLCDPHIFMLAEMDHSIALLCDAVVATIPKQAILELTDRYPSIARSFWWSALVDEGVLRQWLVNIGQLEAYERLAHLFCELWLRMCHVGLTKGGAFTMPLTQEQLGETVGLTAVHVNRTLQRMRAEGLISLEGRALTIINPDRLKRIAGFNANYLHLVRRT